MCWSIIQSFITLNKCLTTELHYSSAWWILEGRKEPHMSTPLHSFFICTFKLSVIYLLWRGRTHLLQCIYGSQRTVCRDLAFSLHHRELGEQTQMIRFGCHQFIILFFFKDKVLLCSLTKRPQIHDPSTPVSWAMGLKITPPCSSCAFIPSSQSTACSMVWKSGSNSLRDTCVSAERGL